MKIIILFQLLGLGALFTGLATYYESEPHYIFRKSNSFYMAGAVFLFLSYILAGPIWGLLSQPIAPAIYPGLIKVLRILSQLSWQKIKVWYMIPLLKKMKVGIKFIILFPLLWFLHRT